MTQSSEDSRKIALVTGGSRGIGAAIVRALAARDCHVVINFKSSAAQAEELLSEVRANGGSGSLAQTDISDFDSVKKMLSVIRKEHSRLDVLVNSAGILEEKLVFFQSVERFWDVMHVNLGGTLNTCKAASTLLGKHKSGRIVNLSSIAASHGTTGLSAYACSKAAVESLTKVLARELAATGVRVNAIAPGLIETDMTETLRHVQNRDESLSRQPVTRIGTPQEVAQLATFLALDAPDYMTGECLRLDGGAAIA